VFPARLFWHTRGRLRRSPRYTDRSCSARSASGLFAQIESMRASFCLDSIKKMGHLRQASKDTVLKRRVKSQRRWAIEAPMHSIASEPGRFVDGDIAAHPRSSIWSPMRRRPLWRSSVSAKFSDRRRRFRGDGRGHAVGVSPAELVADRPELALLELADRNPAPAIGGADHCRVYQLEQANFMSQRSLPCGRCSRTNSSSSERWVIRGSFPL